MKGMQCSDLSSTISGMLFRKETGERVVWIVPCERDDRAAAPRSDGAEKPRSLRLGCIFTTYASSTSVCL